MLFRSPFMRLPIPDDLWAELRAEGLIDPMAPVRASAAGGS